MQLIIVFLVKPGRGPLSVSKKMKFVNESVTTYSPPITNAVSKMFMCVYMIQDSKKLTSYANRLGYVAKAYALLSTPVDTYIHT